MSTSKQGVRKTIGVITFAVLLFVGVWHLGTVASAVSSVLQMISFFIIGLCVAFLLNPLLSLIENRLFKGINKRLGKRWMKIRRPLSLVLTLLGSLGLLTAALLVVIPQIVSAISMLSAKLPTLISDVSVWYQETVTGNPDSVVLSWLGGFNLPQFSETVANWFETNGHELLTGTFNTAASLSSSVFSYILGFVLSIYILIDKDRLLRQAKRTLYAFLPKARADRIGYVAQKASYAFTSFFTGQFLEAVTLGFLVFIGMTIFRFPYALSTGIMIAVFSFIPYFGAFISAFLGGFMILVSQGLVQALYFVLFIVILQQIDGALIYPRIVGKPIRLPGMWVLTAATIGGKVAGIVGVLISIPFCSLCYTLLREAVEKREVKQDGSQDSLIETSQEPL